MKISVVIPVKNGADTLKECLEGIFAQNTDWPVEVLAIDSGSTDGSLEILKSYPVSLVQILPEDFSHGDTRNLGALLTQGDFMVFTVQDATPKNELWLHNLVKNLAEDPQVGGAFSRIIPREDCGPLVERGVQGDLNYRDQRIVMAYESFDAPEAWNPHERRVNANFNDVSSCIRRSVWEKIPFQRTPFGEDIVWADSALRAGHKVVFDPTSVSIHSHEYQIASIFPRTHVDAWFNKAYFDRLNIEKLTHVFIHAWRQFKDDKRFLKTKNLPVLKRWRETAVSMAFHFMEFYGFYRGGLCKMDRIPPVRESKSALKLFLCFGEALVQDQGLLSDALDLAITFEKMGHHPHLVCPPGTKLDPGTKALPLHQIQDGDGAFNRLLDQEKPDVVHGLDFSQFTGNLLEGARKANLPTLVTLNDFWFQCPKRDLLRPHNRFCSKSQPQALACLMCLKGQEEFIFPALMVDKLALKARPLAPLRKAADSMAPHCPKWAGIMKRTQWCLDLLDQADYIIAPHGLIRARCVEHGLNKNKVVHIPHPRESEALKRLRKDAIKGDEQLDKLEQEPLSNVLRCAKELLIKYKQAGSFRFKTAALE